MAYTIGVDIGATKVAAGLVSGGKVVKKFSATYSQEDRTDKKRFSAAIVRAIESVWQKSAQGIGLGVAGVTDPNKNVLLQGANFPSFFRNVDFGCLLKKFDRPIRIDNDVHAFALGETVHGQGRGHDLVFGLTVGTGIGGALVLNGRIVRGRNNAAGEVGHTVIQMDGGASCSLGQSGHLESYVSGNALRRMIGERLTAPVLPENLEDLAAAGNREAIEIIAVAARALAVGFANVIQTVNPDIIVVGGGLSRMQTLWRGSKEHYRSLVTYQNMRSTPIVRSKPAFEAGIIGAAQLIAASADR
ncbi:MAG: ROK family protein [bacterium]